MPERGELDDVAAEEQRDRPVGDDPRLPAERSAARTGGTSVRPTSRGTRGAGCPGARRSPCSGRASPPARACGTRTPSARRRGSSRACAPAGARAGRSAGRAPPASSCWGRRRSRPATTRRACRRRGGSRRPRRGRGRRAGAAASRAPGARARRRPRRASAPGRASRRRGRPPGRRTTRGSSRRGSRSRGPRARGACTRPSLRGISGRIRGAASTSTQRCRRPAKRRIGAANRVLGEVVQLGQRLDAGVARADEDEAEVARGLVRVQTRCCGLERAEEPVAERDRVGDVLETLAVLGEARDRERPRHGAERDDEPLVPDLERTAERLGDDRLPLGVAREDAAEQQLRVRAHRPERHDDVPRLERARQPPRAGAACRA